MMPWWTDDRKTVTPVTFHDLIYRLQHSTCRHSCDLLGMHIDVRIASIDITLLAILRPQFVDIFHIPFRVSHTYLLITCQSIILL